MVHFHRSLRSDERSRQRRGTRGAVIVEAAFLAPLALFLLMGIVEAGNLLYADLSVEAMATQGGRTASLVTNQPEADVKILDKIEAESGASTLNNITRVVIYEATSRNAGPTAACKAGTSSSSCSVYGPADFAKSKDQLSCGWCPADRAAGALVGVWVQYSHPSVTGLLGDKTVTSQSVIRLEAGA